MVMNLETNKVKKVAACHETAKPLKSIVAGNGQIFSIGDDCVVRVWQNIWNMAA